MKNFEDLMALARKVEPKPETRPLPEVMPVVKVLREEKRLTWDEIRDWMNDNAGIFHSHTFWANKYKQCPK